LSLGISVKIKHKKQDKPEIYFRWTGVT